MACSWLEEAGRNCAAAGGERGGLGDCIRNVFTGRQGGGRRQGGNEGGPEFGGPGIGRLADNACCASFNPNPQSMNACFQSIMYDRPWQAGGTPSTRVLEESKNLRHTILQCHAVSSAGTPIHQVPAWHHVFLNSSRHHATGTIVFIAWLQCLTAQGSLIIVTCSSFYDWCTRLLPRAFAQPSKQAAAKAAAGLHEGLPIVNNNTFALPRQCLTEPAEGCMI